MALVDLIRRADAIQEFGEYLMMEAQQEYAGTASEDIEDWKDLAEHILKDIPSAEPKQEWIPCSERLPSELGDDKRVLATIIVDELGVIVMPSFDVKSWYLEGYVSAWMPLPTAYEGADNNV